MADSQLQEVTKSNTLEENFDDDDDDDGVTITPQKYQYRVLPAVAHKKDFTVNNGVSPDPAFAAGH